MSPPTSLRRLAVLVHLVLALTASARSASAQLAPDAPEDDPRFDPTLAPPAFPLWIGVEGRVARVGTSQALAGAVLLGGRFDELVASPEVRAGRALAKETSDEAAEETSHGTEPADREGPALDGELARGAVRAATAHAGDGRLDELARRARWSGLMPELRVRVAHVTDQGEALSPTEYDPERITASGGTSLWLEGRATFRLDRLVFAEDEVALERLRETRERARRAIADEVLRRLEQWARARRAADDLALDDDAREAAELDAAVAESALDVLTDGWFRDALRRRTRR